MGDKKRDYSPDWDIFKNQDFNLRTLQLIFAFFKQLIQILHKKLPYTKYPLEYMYTKHNEDLLVQCSPCTC